MDPNRLLADVNVPEIIGPGVKPAGNGVAALEKIVGQVIGVLTIFAVIWFAIQIILAGYSYINSQGDEKNMAAARSRLTNGVLGLTIVIVAVGLGSLIATLAGITNVLDINALFTQMGL
ncbi:hypothetical protein HYV64_03945 [Candidatus Shapirobacteria bacterium]|nr:hypothetical protein [Candidatus Shapirobacteria bacterium]